MRFLHRLYALALIALAPLCWAAPEIELSAAQQTWLREHPLIVWGLEKDYPPYILSIRNNSRPACLMTCCRNCKHAPASHCRPLSRNH